MQQPDPKHRQKLLPHNSNALIPNTVTLCPLLSTGICSQTKSDSALSSLQHSVPKFRHKLPSPLSINLLQITITICPSLSQATFSQTPSHRLISPPLINLFKKTPSYFDLSSLQEPVPKHRHILPYPPSSNLFANTFTICPSLSPVTCSQISTHSALSSLQHPISKLRHNLSSPLK